MIKETEFVSLVFVGIVMTLILCVGVVLVLLKMNKNRLAHREEIQEIELKKKEEMLRNSISAEENERQRIAKELHDDVNNRLVLIQRQMNQCENTGEMVSELDATMVRLREISHELIPPGLEKFGLSAAIEDLVVKLENNGELEVEADLDESAEPKSREVHLSIFRIVQELVGNTLKYANASRVNLNLAKHEGLGVLSYSDNGSGFDVEKAKDNNSLGLKNIESRASFANADFDLRSEPGKGMSFKLTWKL